jgi:hypothetical protein
MKNTFFRWNGEILVTYGRKQSELDEGVSCTLFS